MCKGTKIEICVYKYDVLGYNSRATQSNIVRFAKQGFQVPHIVGLYFLLKMQALLSYACICGLLCKPIQKDCVAAIGVLRFLCVVTLVAAHFLVLGGEK